MPFPLQERGTTWPLYSWVKHKFYSHRLPELKVCYLSAADAAETEILTVKRSYCWVNWADCESTSGALFSCVIFLLAELRPFEVEALHWWAECVAAQTEALWSDVSHFHLLPPFCHMCRAHDRRARMRTTCWMKSVRNMWECLWGHGEQWEVGGWNKWWEKWVCFPRSCL